MSVLTARQATFVWEGQALPHQLARPSTTDISAHWALTVHSAHTTPLLALSVLTPSTWAESLRMDALSARSATTRTSQASKVARSVAQRPSLRRTVAPLSARASAWDATL